MVQQYERLRWGLSRGKSGTTRRSENEGRRDGVGLLRLAQQLRSGYRGHNRRERYEKAHFRSAFHPAASEEETA